MNASQKITQFLASSAFAVAGASTNREKFGNKILRCYLQHNQKVFAINPRATEIEGVVCVNNVMELPLEVQSLSIVTPPSITETVVMQAINKGIQNIWMQPGAESEQAIVLCIKHHINVIADGSCLLVVLGFQE